VRTVLSLRVCIVIFPGLHLLVTTAYGVLLVNLGPVNQGLVDHVPVHRADAPRRADRAYEGTPRACPSRMTPMQHTLSHAAMPKRSRQQPRPSADLTVRRRTATRDSVRRESSASTLPELSRALRSTLWTIRARAAPAGPRTRAA